MEMEKPSNKIASVKYKVFSIHTTRRDAKVIRIKYKNKIINKMSDKSFFLPIRFGIVIE